MSEYDDGEREEERGDAAASPRSDCPRWMYHRPGVFCHTCQQVGGKTVKGVSLHLDLPPGGNVRSDFKKPKEKKGKK